MRLHDKKVFLDREKLAKLFTLRRQGFALSTLSLLFGVDRSSISYQLEKYSVEPQTEAVYSFERIVRQVLPPPFKSDWKIVNGERFNMGKSYKEYLAISS